MIRRINQTIHLQQTREEVYNRAQKVQENIKRLFDKRTKACDFTRYSSETLEEKIRVSMENLTVCGKVLTLFSPPLVQMHSSCKS